MKYYKFASIVHRSPIENKTVDYSINTTIKEIHPNKLGNKQKRVQSGHVHQQRLEPPRPWHPAAMMLGCHDIPPCRKTVRANHSSPLAMKIVRSWDELGTCWRREQQPPAHPYPLSQYPIGISRNSRRVLLVRQCGAREVVTRGFGVCRSRALRHSSAYWSTRGRHRSATPSTDRFGNSGVRACMWRKRQER